jgi:hypothetical protein
MAFTWQATRGLAAAAMMLCLAAFASWKQFARTTHSRGEPDAMSLTADRFEELKDNLPAHGVVCYLSDMDFEDQTGSGSFYLAAYSLAPVVLRAGTDCETVVGNFADPAAAPTIIEKNGLQVLRRYYPGLMLLQRKPR